MKKITLGILAHVDSGKTTLSEAFLYKCGEIRTLGRVDHKNTLLDNNEIEKDRGITIFSKQAIITFGDTEFTLLDTPGHVDFSSEMERTLSVLDYAILVISGLDGVQNHTKTLWRLLNRYSVPTFIFVNKMDISPISKRALLNELKEELSDYCVDFSEVEAEEKNAFFENVAVCDEGLMDMYFSSGSIEDKAIADVISKRKIFPCFFGSALKTDGVSHLLSSLENYCKMQSFGKEFGAKVFKISEDSQKNRLTFIKITGGKLSVRDTISAAGLDKLPWNEKINSIRIYQGAKFKTVDEADAGTVCAVVGLSKTYPGQGLGVQENCKAPLLEPVLSYNVIIPPTTDLHTMLMNLRKLEAEDPQLHVLYNEPLKEINIQLMGEIQLEVLKKVFFQRYNTEIDFGSGKIAYKETITNLVEGVGHYEPLRHYSEVHLLLEPGKPGSGLVFSSECSEDLLAKNWQRLILSHLDEKTHLGVLTGSPITDIKITLVSGRAHKEHTDGGDFRQATYRAVRHGLRMANSVLLEPYYDFTLEIPSDCVGRAMMDIQQMDGTFLPPEVKGDFSILKGSAPVAKMRDYHLQVTSYTKGTGRLSCVLGEYRPCREQAEIINEIGYDPDADLDNTADSVFCSHGAGFSVKWNEVYNYMHLGAYLKATNETPAEEALSKENMPSAMKSFADDKELMAIFERTYGPVKRKLTEVLKTKRFSPPPEKKFKMKNTPNGDNYLLVDGYNIIYAWEELAELAKENLDLARNRLADILCNYCGFVRCNVILVFDAYKVKNNPGTIEKIHNIDVVYTKEAETADMYIEKVTHKLSKNNRVRVATSDSLEQIIILGGGAHRLSASDLKAEIDFVEKSIKEFIKSE